MAVLMSCQESLEERAFREAKEYTQRCCPTPVVNGTRTDSVIFDISTKTYTYYCSFSGDVDDKAIIDKHRGEIHDNLLQNIKNNTQTRKFKEAGFNFSYVVHSAKNPKEILYRDKFTKKDYK